MYEVQGIKGSVIVVLKRLDRVILKRRIQNLVVDTGDEFYAYRAVIQQPTDDLFTTGAAFAFDGIMELFNGATPAAAKGFDRSDAVGPVGTSQKAMDSGYPKRDDDDVDNPDRAVDVVTYRVQYTTGEANATGIDNVIITNPSPGAAENILMLSAPLGDFAKTSSDTLKMFVNHTMNGT